MMKNALSKGLTHTQGISSAIEVYEVEKHREFWRTNFWNKFFCLFPSSMFYHQSQILLLETYILVLPIAGKECKELQNTAIDINKLMCEMFNLRQVSPEYLKM